MSPKSVCVLISPVARTSSKVTLPLFEVNVTSFPFAFRRVTVPKSELSSISAFPASMESAVTSPLLLDTDKAPSRFSTVTTPKSLTISVFPVMSVTLTSPKLPSMFTVVSVGTVTKKSTVLILLLKFMDFGSSYLRVTVLPDCSIVYLMLFTSSSARAWVES